MTLQYGAEPFSLVLPLSLSHREEEFQVEGAYADENRCREAKQVDSWVEAVSLRMLLRGEKHQGTRLDTFSRRRIRRRRRIIKR